MQAHNLIQTGQGEVENRSGANNRVITGLQVWKTIRPVIGNIAEIPLDFKRGTASAMLEKVVFPELDLVVVSGRDLGFDKNVDQIEIIFDQAIKIGLQLCPAFIGPWLRQCYQDQPSFERLWIGMEPMIVNGSPEIFIVQHFSGLTLGAEYARADIGWYPDFLWVFIKPRK
jgi:hypothetical protein